MDPRPSRSLLAAALAIFTALPAGASIEVLSTRRETWRPERAGCGERGDCSLVRFSFILQPKRVLLPGETARHASYMTDIRAVLETDSAASIEDYAVVQFLRGCKFRSAWEAGAERRSLEISREYFGGSRTFLHRDWEVDSDSADPIYTSYESERFGLWRWNSDPGSYEPEGATFYLNARPTRPVVFLTDMPGASGAFRGAYGGGELAHNSTLEFRTCLFKTADLPAATDPAGSNIDKAKALHCFEWMDSWVFDFRLGRVTSPGAVDPVCR